MNSVFCQARSQFKSRSTANNVSILVPVPSDADSPKFKTSTGSAKWVPEKNVVQWNIKSFPVSVEHQQHIRLYNAKYSWNILNTVVFFYQQSSGIRKIKLCFYDDGFKKAAIYNIMIDLPHAHILAQSHLICSFFFFLLFLSTKKKTCIHKKDNLLSLNSIEVPYICQILLSPQQFIIAPACQKALRTALTSDLLLSSCGVTLQHICLCHRQPLNAV